MPSSWYVLPPRKTLNWLKYPEQEQAYPWPPYLVSTVFGVCLVVLSLTAINATGGALKIVFPVLDSPISSPVFAQYTMHALDITVTPFRQKGLAVAMVTFTLIRKTSQQTGSKRCPDPWCHAPLSLCTIDPYLLESHESVSFHQTWVNGLVSRNTLRHQKTDQTRTPIIASS